ncbi:peptide-methionine (R)-S-oxide reductase, partial [Candidatus Woesearchaeota archaeon]|nr:peptide-methionine (R)-S-oxide reductase [Candidatus Woesearchaeota archaeon]
MVQKGRGDMFCCNGCGNRLFSLDARYDSGTGWPCFFRAFDSSSVATESLTNKKVKKIQVKCKRCGHHLGHL